TRDAGQATRPDQVVGVQVDRAAPPGRRGAAMRHARLVGNERGVTLALMAVVMFLALGMGALAIDYGMVKSAKAEAQRAMDAAALAGGSALIISDPAVDKTAVARARAKEFAAKHTVRGVLIDTTTGTGEVTVDVDLVNFTVKASWARSGMGLWFA